MISGLPYGESVDWWSLGILLYEMMVGRPPFKHDNAATLLRLIQYREVVIPSSFSQEAQDIIRELLQKNPKSRLGCKEDIGEQEIRDHQFFISMNWAEIEQGTVSPPRATTYVNSNEDQSTDLPEGKMTRDVRKVADESFRGFSFYNDKYEN